MMQHIIKRQVIDLTLHKKLDAFSIQQTVSDYYYVKILPLLLQAFDAASSEEETITIDRLEIDVGILGIKELEKGDWSQKIFKNISEQLIPVKFGLTSQVKAVQVKAVHKSRALSIADQWLFYMRRGYFSWNVLDINEDWYKGVLEAFAAESAAIKKLRELISNYPLSVKRIVAQHSESFLTALVEALTATSQVQLTELIIDLAKIKSVYEKDKHISASLQTAKSKLQFWEQVLQMAVSSGPELKPAKIIELLIADSFHVSTLNKKKMKDFMIRNNLTVSELEQKRAGSEKESSHLIDVALSKDRPMEELPIKDSNIEIDGEGIYLVNAGVVLLHPFLQRFFGNLQLIKEDFFADATSQQKALYLLHYLATGNINPPEHELTIAKLLCSFSLEHPVDTITELSNEEMEEAESLLASAIGQWDILKGTSPNGLRESFLQRKGKLVTINGSMVLQVEQSSIDMLLDHLPWNISIIKLPWMKDILKVEWR